MGFWRDLWYGPPEIRTATPPTQPPAGSGVQPPPRDRAATVTTSDALGLEAVFRAIQLIVAGVEQLTIDAYRGGTLLEGRTVAAYLTRPNVDQSLSAFLDETAASLALDGNAYWRIYRSTATGEINNLQVLPPAEVIPTLDPATGRRKYGWRGHDYDHHTIRHLAYLRIPGRASGLGPIQAAQARLHGAVSLNGYAADWFDDSAVPTGVLSTDQHLTTDQAATWREQWTESQRRRGTAVLGAGLTYGAITLSPKDAQFLESQQFTTTAIARLFGIPAHLMLAAVEGNSQTYQNLAQADLSFVRWTLSMYTREIEEAFTSLLPRGQSARFNLDAVLRPDTGSRYAAHAVAIEQGFLTVDEVRAIEGYSPLSTPTETS